ncbi:PaaI family thioesterase [Sphingomonas aerophila]|uniref:Acyl-coenzyme A thioesterase PaaI-like protein n=1 Tax=Sphingomonas aerophila TaxID=1344948 RepID=A0A7W9BDF6_9SPHN|nr:PaaI family thioesterase [Sphingomonas aerophila]MBB5715112.1 acyl-coenzyme A thioesterase PaaI-like protein [Sphingomonas aerophila]
MLSFDLLRFVRGGFGGHGGRIGIEYHDHGTDWCELALPWREDLTGDDRTGAMAAGPVVSLLDVAASLAVWHRRGQFVPHATLDLRLDHLRAPRANEGVIGRGECYRIEESVSFVRGIAHEGDPDDPIAHLVGTYMVTGARP